jgi:hypothetical protein
MFHTRSGNRNNVSHQGSAVFSAASQDWGRLSCFGERRTRLFLIVATADFLWLLRQRAAARPLPHLTNLLQAI